MSYQKGVGMIEIIVSILVLAIAVLGFMALQYRSLELASEAMQKVEAANLARNLSERMYVNRTAYSNEANTGLADEADVSDCVTKDNEVVDCTPSEFMEKDIADVQAIAAAKGMKINLLTCPNTVNNRKCIYVAWDDTEAEQGADNDNACTAADKFSYYSKSKCIVVEAF